MSVLEFFPTNFALNLEWFASGVASAFSAFIQMNGTIMAEHIASSGISLMTVRTLNWLVGISFVTFHVMSK